MRCCLLAFDTTPLEIFTSQSRVPFFTPAGRCQDGCSSLVTSNCCLLKAASFIDIPTRFSNHVARCSAPLGTQFVIKLTGHYSNTIDYAPFLLAISIFTSRLIAIIRWLISSSISWSEHWSLPKEFIDCNISRALSLVTLTHPSNVTIGSYPLASCRTGPLQYQREFPRGCASLLGTERHYV